MGSNFNRGLRLIVAVLLVGLVKQVPAQTDRSPVHCDLCGKLFVQVSYRRPDKVTGEAVLFCHLCARREHDCYACGLPIIQDKLSLEDDRHFCARDAKNAIINTNAVLRIAAETDGVLRRQLQDFLSFPEEHLLDRRVIDRLELQNWYKVPGHDHQCPNILGVHELVTNNGALTHRIHLLSGQTLGETRTTYAHELTHAWVAANVSPERQLGRLAQEGFCELIAYLVATQLGDTKAQQLISSNTYTRGQFSLFRAAYETYTLRPVIDWVKHGAEPELDAADLDKVRRTELPPPPLPRNYVRYVNAAEAREYAATQNPDAFELKAVMGTPQRRTALINGRAFLAGETGRVRKGGDYVEIRCVAIEADSATIEVLAGARREVLRLTPAAAR